MNPISERKIILAITLFVAFTLQVFSQKAPQRVEPAFWWSGMHHNELQLLVYGENISQTRVAINYPGVILKEVVSVESPNYLFLYLDIENAQPGSFNIDFMTGRRATFRYNYELRAREANAQNIKGFDGSDAMYLLMPDRFAQGTPVPNPTGMLDVVDRNNPNARHGGNLQGIIDHLDFIASMGFTSVWLNPVFENNQPRYSYHGYAITDFYRVDPRFGTNNDFRRLVQEAKKHDIKIIKDVIFNHSGDHHWWMKDLPMRSWLNQWDDFTRTTYRMTTIVDPHAARADYKRMMNGWFDTHMPDLNQKNRLLATYLMQNSVWWIEFSGIQGIRVDTQPYADKDFMADWAKYVMAEYPHFNIVGEAWSGLPALTSYFQGGKEQFDGYNSHVPAVFDFSLYDAIGQAFNEDQGWDTGMMCIYNSLAQDFLYHDPHNLVIFGDNHDTNRFLTRVGDNTTKLKMGLALIATMRGIPMIYTGTETLESAYEHDGHGIMRKTFPGGFPNDPVNAFTREGRTEAQNDIVDYMSRLFNFRKQKAVLHNGLLRQYVPEDNVYVYFRYNNTEKVMVVINNNDNAKNLNLSRYADSTRGFSNASEILSGQSYNLSGQWSVPGRTAMVLELK
jgi:neopullulanase